MKNKIEMEDEIRNYTVLIYTENQIGLLAQISNVFTRRSLNIWTLSAGPTAIEGIHTITITTDATRRRIEDAVKQIEKRVDVISATFYTSDEIVYRELVLCKVPSGALLESGAIERLLSTHHARILEMNPSFTVLQKTGTLHETTAFYESVKPFGVLQFVRSGRVAVSRNAEPEIRDCK